MFSQFKEGYSAMEATILSKYTDSDRLDTIQFLKDKIEFLKERQFCDNCGRMFKTTNFKANKCRKIIVLEKKDRRKRSVVTFVRLIFEDYYRKHRSYIMVMGKKFKQNCSV